MPEAPHLDDESAIRLVREGYDAIAERYLDLAVNVPPSHPRHDRVGVLLARLPEAGEVLEVGCGGGLPVARRIVDAGHRYTGIDISARQIDLARRHVPDGEFLVGDVNDLSFAPNTFDAVMMLYAMTHVPAKRWPTLAHRIHEWLTAGGLFLVNVPGHASPGWLEEDFLGLGVDNWTNSLAPTETYAVFRGVGFDVIEHAQIPDDEPGPGWVWILAAKRA